MDKVTHLGPKLVAITALSCSCIIGRPDTKVSERPSPTTWCEAQGDSFKRMGLECNDIAGSGNTELMAFEIPGQHWRRLTECLPRATKENFGYHGNKAEVTEYRENWSSDIDLSAGLNLRKVSPWLPSLGISGGQNKWFRVEIKIKEAEYIVISDASRVFRDMLKNRNLSAAEKDNIASCLKILCSPDTVLYTQALVGIPEITFITDAKVNATEDAGWKWESGQIGLEGTEEGSRDAL